MPSGYYHRTKNCGEAVSQGMKREWYIHVDAPYSLGEKIQGSEIGRGRGLHIWDACPNCKKENWRRKDCVGINCAKCSQYLINQRSDVNRKKSESLKGYREFRFNKGKQRGRSSGFICSPEHIEKVRQAAKERWGIPEKRDKMIKSFLEMRSPNQHELIIQEILDGLHPNEWKFVGNGIVIINGLNPDSINVNDKKLIIEYFGRFWHRPQDGKFKSNMYAKLGYKTLIIWSEEIVGLDWEEKLKTKINDFWLGRA